MAAQAQVLPLYVYTCVACPAAYGVSVLYTQSPVAPVAYLVILEPGICQFREFESPRVHTRAIGSWGLFLVHKLTCGKRDSASKQRSMKNRRVVGLLNPMRDKNGRQEPEGKDDACDHGLSRSWKVDVCEKKTHTQ